MIKFLLSMILIGAIAVGGYCLYRGLTGEKNNAGIIAIDAGNLAESVTNTLKDGMSDVAKDIRDKAKEKADTAVKKAMEKADSAVKQAKEKTDTVVSDTKDMVKQKAKEKLDEAK